MKTTQLMTVLLAAAGLTGVGGAWAQTGTRMRGTPPCAAPKRNTRRPSRRVTRFRAMPRTSASKRPRARKGSPRRKPRPPTENTPGRARRFACPCRSGIRGGQGEVRRPVRQPEGHLRQGSEGRARQSAGRRQGRPCGRRRTPRGSDKTMAAKREAAEEKRATRFQRRDREVRPRSRVPPRQLRP